MAIAAEVATARERVAEVRIVLAHEWRRAQRAVEQAAGAGADVGDLRAQLQDAAAALWAMAASGAFESPLWPHDPYAAYARQRAAQATGTA